MGTFRSARNGKLPGEETLEQQKKKNKSVLMHGEKAGILLAVALFCYCIKIWDIPAAYFLMGFLFLYVNICIDRSGAEKFRSVGNVFKWFGISLSLGALVLMFL